MYLAIYVFGLPLFFSIPLACYHTISLIIIISFAIFGETGTCFTFHVDKQMVYVKMELVTKWDRKGQLSYLKKKKKKKKNRCLHYLYFSFFLSLTVFWKLYFRSRLRKHCYLGSSAVMLGTKASVLYCYLLYGGVSNRDIHFILKLYPSKDVSLICLVL